jgi:hypothetical protein
MFQVNERKIADAFDEISSVSRQYSAIAWDSHQFVQKLFRNYLWRSHLLRKCKLALALKGCGEGLFNQSLKLVQFGDGSGDRYPKGQCLVNV